MSHNNTHDGKLAEIDHENEEHVHLCSRSEGKLAQLGVFKDERSIPKPSTGRLMHGERANASTNNPTTSNNIPEPNDIPNTRKQPRTYAAAHPEFQSKPIIYIPSPRHKRRMAAAENDLKRRNAIEAAILNLGHSYQEAVVLVDRLKELDMDLVAFVKNTDAAKERSSTGGGPRRRKRGMIGRRDSLGAGLGALIINHGKSGGGIKDESFDGEGDEEQGNTEGEEWRFWCE